MNATSSTFLQQAREQHLSGYHLTPEAEATLSHMDAHAVRHLLHIAAVEPVGEAPISMFDFWWETQERLRELGREHRLQQAWESFCQALRQAAERANTREIDQALVESVIKQRKDRI